VAVPAGHQSSNGLVEPHRKVMVHMGYCYLTEEQMPRTYWFFVIAHAACMMNAIPGKIHGHLASPFLLFHGSGHNERTLILLFAVCFFYCYKDSPTLRSKNQAHTMGNIVIGRSPMSNAFLVYNPWNKQYYKPDSYHLDTYHLPSLVYLDVKNDGGLFCFLLRDNNPPMEEKYLPSTHVEQVDPFTNMLMAGTVMDIPFSSDVSDSSHNASYTILFEYSTTSLDLCQKWLALFLLHWCASLWTADLLHSCYHPPIEFKNYLQA
jgi:hypothetical protein